MYDDDILERHLHAIESGDYELLRDLLHPECELGLSGSAFVVRGPDNFIKVMRDQGEAIKAALKPVTYSIRDMVRTADAIVCESRLTGVFAEPLRTALATHEPTYQPVTIDGCEFVRLADGRVKSWHSYTDGLAAAVAFGIIKPPSNRQGIDGVDLNDMLGIK
jgi:ketosteroid isomerase-like protein